jgi:hypothetical protein
MTPPTPTKIERVAASLAASELDKALALERRLSRLEATNYVLLAITAAVMVRVYLP